MDKSGLSGGFRFTFLLKIIICIKSGTLLGNILEGSSQFRGRLPPPPTGLQEALQVPAYMLNVVCLNTGTTGSTKKTKRPAVEYWNESLRRTGTGFSTESTHMSMTGLGRKQGKDMAYTSTSHYLRQLVGAEKPKRSMGEVQCKLLSYYCLNYI